MIGFFRYVVALVPILLGLLGLAGDALAQPAGTFNAISIGSVGRPTYSASVSALAPAASATDFLTIQGAAGKVIRLVTVRCTGNSTAAATQEIRGVMRSALNTGTTGRTTLTVVPHDSANVAAVAVAYSYTTNPTTLGALVGIAREDLITTNTAATSAFATNPMIWNFSSGEDPAQSITLRGAQVFALNGGAATYSAGTVLDCNLTWTETVN